jgi:hypothetical protein
MSMLLILTELNQSFDEKYGRLVRSDVYFEGNPNLQRNISPPSSVCFLLGLLFDPKNGGDIYIRYLALSSKQKQFAVFFLFLLGLLFNCEDGGDLFFRNLGLSTNYTAL